jgi:probable phosphoglycerate mutase
MSSDYGRFEGMLTSDIFKELPGWDLYHDGCPDGEAPGDVAARADRFDDEGIRTAAAEALKRIRPR